ncbi:PadR family transcriptional regulator [Pseudonocardia alni]|uniref:PadR family transcriptional regulator n=1 Tax=Pseudonocardia alni TaxID=33907 RepID=UPI0034083D12
MDLVRELLRGAVPVHVLHHAAEQEVYGAWMAAELARHGYSISPGTLYPLLHRLQDAGLLTSTERVVDGRVRRVYTTTAAGGEELARLRAVVTELAGEVLPTHSDTERSVSTHTRDCRE